MEFKLGKGGVMQYRDISIVGLHLGFELNAIDKAMRQEDLNEEASHSIIIDRDDITFQTDIIEAIFVHIFFFNPRTRYIELIW